MKPTTLAIIAVAAVLAATITFKSSEQDSTPEHIIEAFKIWQSSRKRLYSTPKEQNFRLKAFRANYEKITAHNAKEGETYTMGLNDFADLTHEEFAARYLQKAISQDSYSRGSALDSPIMPEENLQQQFDNVDWSSKGCATGIYTQGNNCAAGYAIAAANAVSYALVANQGLQTTQSSAQEIIDCSKSRGNSGCNGGYTNNAFDYVYYNNLNTEQFYSYTGRETGYCRTSVSSSSPESNLTQQVSKKFRISNHYKVSRDDNDRLKAAVKQQPVTSAVDASTWAYYNGGVFNGNNCRTDSITHFVTIVGYGTYSGYNYWLVENSWGQSWGINGYMMIVRYGGTGNQPCGIPSNVFYPYGVKFY